MYTGWNVHRVECTQGGMYTGWDVHRVERAQGGTYTGWNVHRVECPLLEVSLHCNPITLQADA